MSDTPKKLRDLAVHCAAMSAEEANLLHHAAWQIEQLEEAVASCAGRVPVPPGPTAAVPQDGWIKHDGGRCPVRTSVYVRYRLRGGGLEGIRMAGEMCWRHTGAGCDVLEYKVQP